jgi:hypothetical protein
MAVVTTRGAVILDSGEVSEVVMTEASTDVAVADNDASPLGLPAAEDLCGDKLVLSHLKEDGRCRFFAVGVHFADSSYTVVNTFSGPFVSYCF